MDEQHLEQNALLASLPGAELAALRPLFSTVDLQVSQSVYQPRQAIEHVYFPLSAVFSMVATTPDDPSVVEVGTIGFEGMVGLPLFLGSPTSPHAVFCQIAGRAACLGAADFYQFLSREGHLHRRLHRFTQTTMVQLAQNVVCNQAHTVEQRAARWLLTTADRVRGDSFVLAEQFFGQMLGVREVAVPETANRLRNCGLIEYSHGQMRILDRGGLLKTCCECYAIVKTEFDLLAAYR